MAGIPDNPELKRQLDKLQGQGEPVNPAEITAIVESIMARLAGDVTAADLKLYAELEALARFIQSARSEIAAVRPHDIGSDIPIATDELDAVVGATEEATNTIMDAAEALTNLAGTLPPEAGEQVTNAVTRIYEACNFQDITGQRITKVVRTLKHIEERVAAMLSAFGDDKAAAPAAAAAAPAAETPAQPAKPTEADLLHGPQLPDDAKKQAEIDAILASFDR